MYSIRSGLTLGFHGCDQSIIEEVILGKQPLHSSKNNYDWLGHGTYFWEYSPARAEEYAHDLKNRPSRAKKEIQYPAVIGAVISLGYCLDLTDISNLFLLKESYTILKQTIEQVPNAEMPKNKLSKDNKIDLSLRYLDCAVIETLHQIRLENDLPAFDSVRGMFWEEDDLYQGAGFKEKNHIQICIRNPNCIKGYFIPRIEELNYSSV